ncbi:MAG TPA: bacillithiol biosynthesis cysteine-adding enzyme BshC [Bacteroidia bacterium]|nr:bacillithiol biosynthesis cysteine-adding enzyme BshC [Bacteroidia bacterium]
MKIESIPLLQTGYIGGLTKAYLEKKEELHPFYEYDFSLSNVEKVMAARSTYKINREVLFEALHEQHQKHFNQFSYLAPAIDLIKNENTFTVTTGHQICLATGPLYFIYKIASTINLCKKLKQQFPEHNFIPIYWMATEDHDFDEINHIHLFNKKIEWAVETSGATGRISTQGIDSFFDEIKASLGNQIEQAEYFELIKECYLKHDNLADATRAMVLNLFPDEGLLVIDADHAKLKNCFASKIKHDIFEKISFDKVSKSIYDLVNVNLIKEDKIQVKPRIINFFYLKDNLRKRIVFEDSLYKVLDSNFSFTKEELVAEIESFPERFSPNVVMRPLYQESILPNLCYIGGAGELSYWFELKATFDAHHTFFPILALRNSFLWIDAKQHDKLQSLVTSVSQIFEPIEKLTEQLLIKLGAEEIDLTQEKINVNNIFEVIKGKISKIDSTLTASVEAELQKLLKSFELIENKASKAQKSKHEISINQLKKLKESLFPANGLQERYENIIWLNMKFGAGCIKTLIHEAHIELACFQILSPMSK